MQQHPDVWTAGIEGHRQATFWSQGKHCVTWVAATWASRRNSLQSLSISKCWAVGEPFGHPCGFKVKEKLFRLQARQRTLNWPVLGSVRQAALLRSDWEGSLRSLWPFKSELWASGFLLWRRRCWEKKLLLKEAWLTLKPNRWVLRRLLEWTFAETSRKSPRTDGLMKEGTAL